MLTKEQKKNRSNYIGASDINGILKKNQKYDNRRKIFDQKALESFDDNTNIYAIAGQVLEKKIQEALDIINLDDLEFKADHFKNNKIIAHIDGLDLNDDKNIVEIKSTKNNIKEAEIEYNYQLQAIMLACNKDKIKLINFQRTDENEFGQIMKEIHQEIGFFVPEKNIDEVTKIIEDKFKNFVINENNIETKIIKKNQWDTELIKKISEAFWGYIKLAKIVKTNKEYDTIYSQFETRITNIIKNF